MRLNEQGILRFRQNINKILIGKEKEPRKLNSFLFKMLLQSLLNLSNQYQTLLQILKQPWNRFQTQHQRIIYHILHHEVPIPFNFLKLEIFIRKCLTNILEAENRLKIQIHLLHFYPHFQHILNIEHQFFPANGPGLHELDIWVLSNSLCFNGMIFQLHLNILNALPL